MESSPESALIKLGRSELIRSLLSDLEGSQNLHGNNLLCNGFMSNGNLYCYKVAVSDFKLLQQLTQYISDYRGGES